ncbi:hypothetical protein PR003_g16010 [Phytophthora rubi]|uniref:Uncharacterized protein n=1 Tax=Phytophthora rubi TaxID=129364 RepID=A0A6A4ES59_9STRA|nr:hypothetical protein PR003_g16010 [Phytophthora rubi]
MSAEVWGDLISGLCDEAQCYDAEMRYQYFLSGLRNKEWKAVLATTMVNSIQHTVAVLLFKNMHLPIEDDAEFAENATSKPNSENAMMQQTQNLLVQQQQQQMARPPRSPRQQVAVAAAYDQPELPGQQNDSTHAAPRSSMPETPFRGNRQGPDMYTQEGRVVCGRCHNLGCSRINCQRSLATCPHCNLKGHIGVECKLPRPGQMQSGGQGGPPRGIRRCFMCQSPDHIVMNCPTRAAILQMTPQGAANNSAQVSVPGLPERRGTVKAVPGECEFDDFDVKLNDNYYYDDEAEDYDYEGREEEALPNEMATYDPTELDYWNGNQEAEACVQQAASVTTARDKESAPEHDYDDAKLEVEACVQQATSVTTACDKESAPEYDYNDVKHEVDACAQQATSVTTACDKESAPEYDYNDVKHEVDACAQQATSVTTARDEGSAPEPDCDYNDYIYENPEVEACAQQTTSTMAARDEESALVPEHDHYEEELEMEVSAQQAASVNEARDTGSALEPETVAESCSPQSAAVTSTPDEEPAPEAKSDGSVSAVRVLFQRPVCEPDPDRTVVYESFGCNTGWGPARAVLAAQERAAQAEACEVSLCEVTSSSNSRRTGEPKGEATTANTAPTTPDPLVPKHPPTESILSKEDGCNLGPALKCPLTESIRCGKDGSNPGPAPECSPSGSMLSEEDGGEPGPSPERDKPDENHAEPSPHARVFTEDELDALEGGEPSSTADEKEKYDKELEERLFPLDEVELAKRMKQNTEQQRELSLPELSKETLAASDEAKRANRDFRSADEGATDSTGVTAVQGREDRERFSREDGSTPPRRSVRPEQLETTKETIVKENIVVSLCSGRTVAIASVSSLTPAETGRLLPSRWRALVRRAVYQLVKAEDRLGADSCPSCSSPLSPRRIQHEERLTDDSPENCDLPVRARSVIKRSVTTEDEQLIEKLVKEVVDAYTTNATLIQSKVVERGSRCPRCRSLSKLPTRSAAAKRVSFDCSSLFSTRSEAFGSNGSRHDREDGVFEYVYVVTKTEQPGGRRPGLREVPEQPEPDDVDGEPFPDGKRIIGSVGGVEAVSVGFIDRVPADMLIDTGAVASLIDARMLKLVGRGDDPLRPCRRDLNSASGHPLRIRGAIDLPLQLGSREIMRPFIVVDKLHIDVILGTDALKAFRAVVDLDENSVTLKDTGEKFSIGSPRVEEMYSTKISSTVRIRPGGQALVVTDVLGEVAEETTVLVEGLVDLDASVRVTRSLCTVHDKKVVVEVCNPSTEEMVIKKGTLIAAVSVVPESAFETSTVPSPADESEPFSPEENAAATRESDWIHATIAASSLTTDASPDTMPELDKVLQAELKVDFSDSKLGDEQKELFSDLLGSFKDMFVETSMKPGRTDLLEFSIDTGDSAPIKQRPYRVSKAEGDVMESEIQQYQELSLIRPSSSPWASPVLMIRKPDGGIRFCIDYRRLNAVTIKDCYPMPLIDDILDVLGKAKLFSTMDIASGYWNVPMAADSIEKTAFTCKYGLFEWLVMPFGLCNAVPAFERLMENVLVDLKWRTCLVYLDDCVVFSEDFPTHLIRLKQVLERFCAAGFKLKMKKCKWGRDQVAFLGHIVTPSGILPNPEKVKAVMNVKRPHDLHTVRAFLGLTSYFRRYIPGYAAISAPIERLKAKGVLFNWDDDCEAAFAQLKRKLVEPPILVYPDFSKRFKLYVDSSKLAVGACLMQTVDGRERVVAYASKLLVGSEKNWINKQDGTSEIECWGIVWATRKFRCYLDRREFDLYTDHKALTWVFSETNRTSNAKLARAVGERVHPDGSGVGPPPNHARSQPTDSSEPNAIPTEQLLVSPVDVFGLQQARFVEEQRRTPWILAMLAYLESGALALDPQLRTRTLLMAPNYIVRNGVLMRRLHLKARAGPARSLEVPVIPLQFISTVLHHCHTDVLAAHVGVTKTMDKVRKHAFWHGWKRDVAEYVRECATCGSGNGHRPWRNGLMQRMPIHELSGPFSLLVVDRFGRHWLGTATVNIATSNTTATSTA